VTKAALVEASRIRAIAEPARVLVRTVSGHSIMPSARAAPLSV
jgi:hypothetical protein